MKILRSVLLMFLFASVGSAQIHVGPGQPYPDIAAAAHARIARPGDTIFVHAGTYDKAQYVIDSLIGTPDEWITIMPFAHDSVSIHQQYTVQAAQYLKVSGLHFYGDDRADSTLVYHLLFFDYQYDCFTSNHNIIIQDCEFSNLNNTGKAGSGACLKIDGTDNFQVLRCIFRDGTNITDGISLNADRNGTISHCTFENMPGDGSHCKGGAKNITYEYNLFRNCNADGLDVGGDTGPQFFCPLGAQWEADSIRVYANIFIGGLTGIRLSSCHHAFIFNNTCFKTTDFAFRSLNTSSNGITLDSNYIYNNIFTTYSPYGIYMNASNNFTFNTEFFRNNLFHDYKNPDPAAIGWSELPGVNETGSIIGDPEFADTLNANFSLTSGSPAIGMGYLTSEPQTDYRGMPYSLAKRSIGAFEFQTSGVTETPASDNFSISPNPCSNRLIVTCKIIEPHSEILVLDILGRVVLHMALPQSEDLVPVNTESLPDGEYMLLIRSGNGVLLGHGSFLKMR